MNMDKAYKVSAKRNGKFWTFGSLKKNQWGNWSIGLKVTPELKQYMADNDGRYINFSLFEQEEKREVPAEAQEEIKKLNATVEQDFIPF